MADTKELKYEGLPLVIYTDGGCRERERKAGAGVHGYFYDPTKNQDKVLGMDNWKKDQLTTHGYVDANNYEQMIVEYKAKPIQPTVFVDGVLTLGSNSSNNVAELKAAAKALEIALEAKTPSLTILADSEYVIQGVNKQLENWKASGWVRSNGEVVKNREHWEELDNHLTRFKEAEWKPTLMVAWTQAHVGNYGNERADSLATRGIYYQMPENCSNSTVLDYSGSSGYLNPKVDHNKLLAGQHLYFFSNAHEARKASDGRTIYYMGCQGSDEELHGKPVSDATYIVSYLKEPDPVVDFLIAKQEQADVMTHGRTYMGYLQSILNSKLYTELRERGLPFLTKGKNGRDLYLDDVRLMGERSPPMLAWRDEESLSYVRGLLEGFLARQKETAEQKLSVPGLVVYDRLGHREVKTQEINLVVTDLTELFFAPDEGKKKKGHKLTEFMSPSARLVEVAVRHNVFGVEEEAKIPLTVGLDIARRNLLGSLLGENPKLYAITIRASDHGFRYATIVQTDSDVAIWCAVHSNLRALPLRAK